jgi:hypothetical protein
VTKLQEPAPPGRQIAVSLKKKKAWLVAALAVWFTVFTAGALWLARGRWSLSFLPRLGSLSFLHRLGSLSFLPRFGSRLLTPGGDPQQERLFLLARIENLEKEKMALQRELDRLSANLRQAAAENAELAKRVDQQTLNFRDKAKAIGDLEQKLEEAENEAKAVQQEYMALYARSEAEKGMLKKG